MSKEIDAAIEVMDRAMDDIAELRSQLAAKDAEIAVLREQTLDECEAMARQNGFRSAFDIADTIAALKCKGERDDK